MPRGASCPPVPVEFDALDAAIAAVLRLVGDADGWDARTRQAVMERVQRQLSRLTAVNLAVVAAEQRAGTWGLSGDRDMPALFGRLSRQGRDAGFAAASQAATLAAMPAVADALVDGPVTPRHLQEIARATGSSPKLAEALATSEGQAEVVRLADRLDAGQFAKALAHRAASLDPASRQRTHDEQRTNRCLHLTHTPGGTFVKGRLDSVAGSCLQRAIDALCPLPAADDDRDRGQRQADALTTMAKAVLSDPATTPGSVIPAQVTLIVSEETWAALRTPARDEADDGRADAGRGRGRDYRRTDRGGPDRGASGSASRPAGRGSTRDVVARLQSVAPITDEDGATLPATEIAKALCDCQITRIVMDTAGVPLDEGQGRRLFTAHQRKAVIARDGGGCAFAGCTMPARYTQLHHIRWWSRGGPTDLDAAVQLCDHHHGDVHDHDIRIGRNDDGSYAFTYPDGRLVPGSPPPDRPSGAEPCPAEPAGAGLGLSESTGAELGPLEPAEVEPRSPEPAGTELWRAKPARTGLCPSDEPPLLWSA